MNFEQASKELEEIVKRLESGVSLEDGLKLFERGLELSKFCYDNLEVAKGKISVIRDTLGKFLEEDMK